MSLSPITEGLPDEVTQQLLSDETVYYFSWISAKKQKSKPGSDFWICMTNKRVLYKAKIQDPNNKNVYTQKDGTLPLSKVSFMEASEKKASSGCGCSNVAVYNLQIGTSGGTVIIPMPSKEKCVEVRKVYGEISGE